MSVFAEKRRGQLTGKFCVDVQRGNQRYRERHESLQKAQDDEKRVLALWAQGEASVTPSALKTHPTGISLGEGIAVAKKVLWKGTDNYRRNYGHLAYYGRVLGEGISLDAIDTQSIRKVIDRLDREGKSDATVNRYLSHMRTFLSWHVNEKNRKVPVEDIVWDWRKEKRGRIRTISYEEEATLLSILPSKTAQLVAVAIETGCRKGELLNLKRQDVHDDAIDLWVTKNDEPRTVPVTRQTSEILRGLLRDGMPSDRQIRRHWDKAKDKMGLGDDDEFVFHACRHTCATRMVDADVDIRVIQAWLGHKRIQTTERYAKVRPKKLHSVLGRVGELRARETGKPFISEVLTSPTTSPNGMGIEPKSAVA